MTITIDANWLASRLDDPNIVIIDAREIMAYRSRHIKNARRLGIESVISVADNGANLVMRLPLKKSSAQLGLMILRGW